MTHEDIVYDRRVRVIEYAAKIGNVSEACRVFGVSRKSFYEWINKAEQYGLSALLPRQREAPQVLCRSHTGCGSGLRAA
ncbi:helix-turn-helix domain-containing protein [Janibacter sp. G368]|uniref:helix-turn-helix domain-containing protein n=1 Tax=Janibacter sp. G368 TaxID=3420441 RepID=UPI003D0704DF